LRFLASSHVGVHPSTNDTSARLSMPSKLFDYLSVGLPVVANDVGGWTEIVKSNDLGRITSDDPQEFAGGIIELLGDPEEITKCGRRGIEIIKNKYNWDASAAILAENYWKLV
jgi:glycosyltransferase involved in cell wall biosynthesis